MKLRTYPMPARPGFTLVELLVSMALTLFIMTILVEAFGAGMDTFQNMRALGDVQDSLRSGINTIKADLSMVSLEGNRRFNDANFWDEPRREGFLRIEQATKLNSGAYVDEGVDLDGINHSFLATDHRMTFTVRARGNRRDNFFYDTCGTPKLATDLLAKRLTATNQSFETGYGVDSPNVPPASMGPAVISQWAEVGYYLASPNPTVLQPFIPGTEKGIPSYGPIKLYNLFRAAALVVPFADELNSSGISPVQYTRFSRNNAAGAPTKFLSPNDLAKGPATRTKLYDLSKVISAPENAAVALVCTNVVSFQIRILRDPPTPGVFGGPYEDLPPNKNGLPDPFDTSAAPANFVNPANNGYRLTGLQIILRVYDPASGLTRQATLNQDF